MKYSSHSPTDVTRFNLYYTFGEIIERKQQSSPQNRLLHPAQTGDLLTFRSEKLFWISMQKCLNFI